MDKIECKKVIFLLSSYIDNKLSDEDRFFVENHLENCPICYQKYSDMKNIIQNLHFEYKKLLDEFDKIESSKIFNINEYESFYKNISPYIDDELCYEDSIKFRKYLLKSKPARNELAVAYGLENSIRKSVAGYKNNLNINFSKKILKKLHEENKDTFWDIYKKKIITSFIIVTMCILLSLIAGINFQHSKNIYKTENIISNSIIFPPDDDWIEFTFDENQEALLTYK